MIALAVVGYVVIGTVLAALAGGLAHRYMDAEPEDAGGMAALVGMLWPAALAIAILAAFGFSTAWVGKRFVGGKS